MWVSSRCHPHTGLALNVTLKGRSAGDVREWAGGLARAPETYYQGASEGHRLDRFWEQPGHPALVGLMVRPVACRQQTEWG